MKIQREKWSSAQLLEFVRAEILSVPIYDVNSHNYVNHIRLSNFKRYIRSQALVDRLTDRNLLPNTNIR